MDRSSPIAVIARDNMHVNVVNLLTSCWPIVHRHGGRWCVDRSLNRRHDIGNRPKECASFRRCEVPNSFSMGPGNDECMSLSQRVDVEKRDCIISFVDDSAWNIAGNDPAKQAIMTHGRRNRRLGYKPYSESS